MTELRFRERDRPIRLKPSALIPAAVGFTVQTLILVHRTGTVGLWIALGVLVLLVAWIFLLRRRSMTAADEHGVTIDWGFGRGRTIPWSDVRWLDFRTYSTQAGSTRTARLTRSSGRRRWLPGMSDSQLYPNPALDANFRQLQTLWAAHHDAVVTGTPPTRPAFRRRLRGVLPGALAVLALGLTVAGTVAAAGQRHDLDLLESTQGCGLTNTQSVELCLPQSRAGVVSVSAQGSPFGSSVARLQDPGTGYIWTATFGAANPLVEHARPGETVVVTTDISGGTVDSVRYRGQDLPTTDSPRVSLSRATSEMIAFGSLGLLLAAWALASRRRRPGARFPWWAPLSLPAAGWAFAVCLQVQSAPCPLSWGQYVPGLALLGLGLTVGTWLQRRPRRTDAQIQSVVAAV